MMLEYSLDFCVIVFLTLINDLMNLMSFFFKKIGLNFCWPHSTLKKHLLTHTVVEPQQNFQSKRKILKNKKQIWCSASILWCPSKVDKSNMLHFMWPDVVIFWNAYEHQKMSVMLCWKFIETFSLIQLGSGLGSLKAVDVPPCNKNLHSCACIRPNP